MDTIAQTAAQLDPITLEVIRHGIVSITDQIDANITRTAFSPYIYEYKDYAVGIVNADGHLIAQCTGGMPVFVADAVGTAVRDGLEIYGRERLHRRRRHRLQSCRRAGPASQQHGDVHADLCRARAQDADRLLRDQCALDRYRRRAERRTTTDIFMEGLQLRTIKLWSKGEPIEEVYRIIENNTRFPEELMGDIEAQLAGCLLGRDLTARSPTNTASRPSTPRSRSSSTRRGGGARRDPRHSRRRLRGRGLSRQ